MAVSVYFLWALNPVNKSGEAVFAIFLAVDLVSFMMISYVYRTYKSGDQFSRALLIGACCMILRINLCEIWPSSAFLELSKLRIVHINYKHDS